MADRRVALAASRERVNDPGIALRDVHERTRDTGELAEAVEACREATAGSTATRDVAGT